MTLDEIQARYPRLCRMMKWVACLNDSEAAATLRVVRGSRERSVHAGGGYFGPSCEAVAHWGRGESRPCHALVQRAFQARHVFPVDVRVKYYRTGLIGWV